MAFEIKKAKRQRRPLKINLEGVSGSGKAQPVDEPVLTPRGFVPIGSLSIGDTVYGRDGQPCVVRGVFPQGIKPVFTVRFSDKTSTRSCDEHLWVVQRANGLRGRWHVWPLKEVRLALEDRHGGNGQRFRIPVAEAVQMPTRELPVDPYVLGCLLGDGCFRAAGVTFSTADQAVLDRMQARDPSISFTKCSGGKYDYYVRNVVTRVKALGLHGTDSGTKFIPTEYLFASAEQRLELLRGLCDTDGWRSNGYVDVTLKSKRLADGVAHLARSLGYRTGVNTRSAPKNERIMALHAAGVEHDEIAQSVGSTRASVMTTVSAMKKAGRTGSDHEGYYRVVISCDDTNDLVTLERKRGDKRFGKYRPALQKMIESIEPAGEAECVCIAVDSPDNTYLTRDFIVTHNTYTSLRLAFAMRRAGIGKKIVVADSENESAGLYEGVVQDGERWEYDVCPMPPEKQNPLGYTEAYEYLVSQGFDIIIGDSLTHAWYGAQEIVDKYAAANRNDKFGGWAKVTPQQRGMLATLTDARAHFIGTMRVKSEYDRVQKEGGGGAVIKKVGTKTDQREGAEYEFDCVVRMDKGDIPTDHVIVVDKVRGCTAMDGRRGVNPGPDFWKPLFDWWLSAEAAPAVTSPGGALHDQHAQAIRTARSMDELKAVFDRVNADAKAHKLSADQIGGLTRLKDDRKVQLSKSRPRVVDTSMDDADALFGGGTGDPIGALKR